SRGTSIGDLTIVQSGDDLGYISFLGGSGSNARYAAIISAQVDGTPGSADMPGRLIFSTTPDGSVTPAERMRIDNVGRVVIGGSSAEIFWESSNSPGLQILSTTATGSGFGMARYSNGTGGPRIFLGKSRDASIGGRTVVQSGDTLGVIDFQATDGTDFVQGA